MICSLHTDPPHKKIILKTFYKLPEFIIAALLYWYIGLSAHFDLFPSVWSLYDEKRATQLLIIFISLLLIITSRDIRNTIANLFESPKNYLIFSLFALVLLATLSSFSAAIPIYAFLETLTFMGLLALSLTLAATTLGMPKLILSALIFGTWTFSIIYEIEFITSYIAAYIVDGKIDFRLLFPHYGNIRFFNQFQIWLIPLSLAPLLMFNIKKRAVLNALYLLSGLWITLLITTQSRGAQLSILLALLITYLVYGEASKTLLKICFKVIGIGILSYLFLFKLIPNLISLISEQNVLSTNLVRLVENQDSSQVRIQFLENSIEYILANPILGIGPMHYAYYPGQNAHPHNSILQICAEFGIPFFLLLTSLLLIFIRKWIQYSKNNIQFDSQQKSLSAKHQFKVENNPQLLIILFFTLMSGLLYSMFSGVLVMPMPQTMLFIILGIMIGLLNTQSIQTFSISTFKSVSIQIMTGILAIGLILTILPHLTTRVLHPFFATYLPEYTAGPRYWEIGGLIQQPAPHTPFYYEHPALSNPKVDFADQLKKYP
jgi:O-antigen ligase